MLLALKYQRKWKLRRASTRGRKGCVFIFMKGKRQGKMEFRWHVGCPSIRKKRNGLQTLIRGKKKKVVFIFENLKRHGRVGFAWPVSTMYSWLRRQRRKTVFVLLLIIITPKPEKKTTANPGYRVLRGGELLLALFIRTTETKKKVISPVHSSETLQIYHLD